MPKKTVGLPPAMNLAVTAGSLAFAVQADKEIAAAKQESRQPAWYARLGKWPWIAISVATLLYETHKNKSIF